MTTPFDVNEAYDTFALLMRANPDEHDALNVVLPCAYIARDDRSSLLRVVLCTDDDDLRTIVYGDDDVVHDVNWFQNRSMNEHVDATTMRERAAAAPDDYVACQDAMLLDNYATYMTCASRLFDAMNDRWMRDIVSKLRLDMSLCPVHCVDYMACFEDEDDECAAIRACFPSHDT